MCCKDVSDWKAVFLCECEGKPTSFIIEKVQRKKINCLQSTNGNSLEKAMNRVLR